MLGAAQVSEGLTTEHIPEVREHALHAGRVRVCTRVGVTWRDGCAAVAAWALHYRSQAAHGWRAWRHDVRLPLRGDDDVANKIDVSPSSSATFN